MNAAPQRRSFSKVTTSKNVDQAAPAFLVVSKFGGLTKFCEITGFATSTVWSWLKSGLIPGKHHEIILTVAAIEKVAIDPADFVRKPVVAHA